jgi:hypothetical protein
MQASHPRIVAHAIDWKNVRIELGTTRKDLFERFVKNPADIRLAKEIRRLDDQLLTCLEHMQCGRRHQD